MGGVVAAQFLIGHRVIVLTAAVENPLSIVIGRLKAVDCNWPAVCDNQFEALAIRTARVHIAEHDTFRPNRLFSRCEAPGSPSEFMEMGDLSRWNRPADRTFIDLFPQHGDGY
jgi:hypothetical protein